jgi:Clr5 domain
VRTTFIYPASLLCLSLFTFLSHVTLSRSAFLSKELGVSHLIGMDSWNLVHLDAIGSVAPFRSASNLQGQPERPFNSHASSPPPATPNMSRKYTAEDWDTQKLEIARLYNENTLERGRDFMRQRHGLDAT